MSDGIEYVVCGKCGYENVEDEEEKVEMCESCGFSIKERYCEYCGYDGEVVAVDDSGNDACVNCFCECDWCGEERGTRFMQENGLSLCERCIEDEGRFCDDCGGFYSNDSMRYLDDLGDFCEACFHDTVIEKGLVECESCGEYMGREDMEKERCIRLRVSDEDGDDGWRAREYLCVGCCKSGYEFSEWDWKRFEIVSASDDEYYDCGCCHGDDGDGEGEGEEEEVTCEDCRRVVKKKDSICLVEKTLGDLFYCSDCVRGGSEDE